MIDLEKAKRLWPSTGHSRWMHVEGEKGVVSVIIPTYNRQHLVIEAMNSVWQQTYRPIELIVVDDGSTDCTREKLAQWGNNHANDSDFTVQILTQENRRAPAARNRGLAASRGEFIQFLDSDDLLMPDKIERQVMRLAGSELAFTYSKVEYRDESERVVGQAGRPTAQGKGPYVTGHFWKVLAPLYTRHCCLTVGPWNERLKACEPYEYAARVRGMGFRGSYDDAVLAIVRRQTSRSVSTQAPIRMARASALASWLVLRTVQASDVTTDADYDNLATAFVCASVEFARLGYPKKAKACMTEARRVARRVPLRLQLLAISAAGRFFPLHTIYSAISRIRSFQRRKASARKQSDCK